ncbi:MAG: hypothetical protein DMH00_04760, partial [Acidobacteria bacterium]
KGLTFGADLNVFERFLAPVFAPGVRRGETAAPAGGTAGVEVALMLVTLAVVGGALWLATRFYRSRPEMPQRLAASFPTLARLLANKYYVDELSDLIVIRPYLASCRGFHAFDARVVDGLVNGVRHFTVGLSHLSRFFDQFVVDGLVNAAAYLTRGLSLAFRRLQTGLVQAYLTVFVFGIFLFVSIYLFWHR